MEQPKSGKSINGDLFTEGGSKYESEVEGEKRLMEIMINAKIWPGSVVEEENEQEE